MTAEKRAVSMRKRHSDNGYRCLASCVSMLGSEHDCESGSIAGRVPSVQQLPISFGDKRVRATFRRDSRGREAKCLFGGASAQWLRSPSSSCS